MAIIMSWSIVIQLIILATIFGQIKSQNNTTEIPERDDIPYLKKDRCLIRYTFKDALRNMFSCDIVRKMNPICGRDITIGFSNHAPYASEYEKNGTVTYAGILFGKNLFSSFSCLKDVIIRTKVQIFERFAIRKFTNFKRV